MQPSRVLFRFAGQMNVPVCVRGLPGSVAVGMSMKTKTFFPGLVQDAGSEQNQHGSDAEFKPSTERIGDVHFKKQDDATCGGEGKGMTGPPEEADPATAKKAFFPADESRNSDDSTCRYLPPVLSADKFLSFGVLK